MASSVLAAPLPGVIEGWQKVFAEVPEKHFCPVQVIAGGLKGYTVEEQERLLEDFRAIKEQAFAHKAREGRYVVTAGGPGSGKSVLLEALNESAYAAFAYLDPDRVCLLSMTNTYGAHPEKDAEARYTHWRAGSNVICNALIALAAKDCMNISHGSTLTSFVDKVLGGLREQGYEDQVLIHVTSSDAIRKASCQKRIEDTAIVQCTPEDAVAKGAKFFENLPIYLEHAKEIHFYLRDDMGDAKLAARLQDGKWEKVDEVALKKIAAIHDKHQGEGFWAKHVK